MTAHKTARLPLAMAVVMMLFATSCEQVKELAYVADASRDSAMNIKPQFTKGIQANDLLSIYVESETPVVTIPFNQETNKIAVSDGVVMNPGASTVSGYLVNNEGDIIFPVLGKLHVLGMTHDELAKEIERRLLTDGHILDPVVTVKLLNFTVSVLGDVTRPGQIKATGERLTIFEAISMVGDLTIYGQRENVTIIREENGVRTIGEVDLTSKDIFDSPYYYLHQNDVVYVEPNMKKKRQAERDPMTWTYISAGLSVVSTVTGLIYNIVMMRYYQSVIDRNNRMQ